LQTGRPYVFKSRRGGVILGMVAWPRRELAEPHGAQLLAHRLLRDREPELLPQPLHQVDDAPANHAMHRRDRALLNDPMQRGALDFPEKRAAPRRLAVHQPFRTLGIEPKHPVAHRLQPDPADRRSFPPRASVINRRQGQEPASLSGILRRFRQSAQLPRTVVNS